MRASGRSSHPNPAREIQGERLPELPAAVFQPQHEEEDDGSDLGRSVDEGLAEAQGGKPPSPKDSPARRMRGMGENPR